MQAVCRNKRERRYGYVNALFTRNTGSRRVPYSRPCPTPLCEERVSRLRHNSMNLPVCPGRSRTRHSNHDDCLSAVHGDCTSHTAMLFSLPRPDMKYTVADYDFPADLEQSFLSGALNSTSSLAPHQLKTTSLPGSLQPTVFSSPIPPQHSSITLTMKHPTHHSFPCIQNSFKVEKFGVISSPAGESDSDVISVTGGQSLAPVVPDQDGELLAESLEESLCTL